MDKLFIFAIGGTGSRVLKALTHLLAAGVDINATTVVPIIIDTDAKGGNMAETTDLLNRYRAIRSHLADTDTANTTFFKTRIATLGELAGDNTNQDQYVMNIGGDTDRQFSQYFDLPTIDAANKALIDMLYTDKEQKAMMDVGFKGHPNMGCAVLNQFVGNAEFNNFANAFSPGDGIFIVSSIFGGTGASGFPLLLKNIRLAAAPTPNHAHLQEAPVGAVTVMPYFKLADALGNEIKSSTFLTKTKAALTYYEKNLQGIDSLYYVKDTPGNAYDYDEGGPGQKNEAHFVEFISALAAIDFAANGAHGGAATYKEFSTQTNNNPAKLNDLFLDAYQLVARPMTEFALFCKFMKYELPNATTQDWYKIGTPDFTQLPGGNFWANLTGFYGSHLTWLEQMASHDTKFAPFMLNDNRNDVFGFVNGKNTKSDTWKSASNWALYEVYLNKVNKAKALNRQNNSHEGCFIAIVCEATHTAVEKKIKL